MRRANELTHRARPRENGRQINSVRKARPINDAAAETADSCYALHMLTRRSFVSAILVSALVPIMRPARAAVSRRLTLRQLVGESCHIVIGTPISASTLWEFVGGRRRIVRYSTVRVEDTLDDRPVDSELLVRAWGGTVGGIGQVVHGQAPVTLSERAAFFLCEAGNGTYAVTGWSQGYYRAVREAAGYRLRATREGMKLVGRPESGAVDRLDGCSIEQARELVRSELGRAHR
jgi:hypothetical protein